MCIHIYRRGVNETRVEISPPLLFIVYICVYVYWSSDIGTGGCGEYTAFIARGCLSLFLYLFIYFFFVEPRDYSGGSSKKIEEHRTV